MTNSGSTWRRRFLFTIICTLLLLALLVFLRESVSQPFFENPQKARRSKYASMVSSTDPPIGNGMGGQHYLRPDPEKWSATAATMPIAIVGMSCRFPGDATSPEKLWKLCADGRSAWSQIPSERFNMESFYHPQETNSGTVSSIACSNAEHHSDSMGAVKCSGRTLLSRRCSTF